MSVSNIGNDKHIEMGNWFAILRLSSQEVTLLGPYDSAFEAEQKAEEKQKLLLSPVLQHIAQISRRNCAQMGITFAPVDIERACFQRAKALTRVWDAKENTVDIQASRLLLDALKAKRSALEKEQELESHELDLLRAAFAAGLAYFRKISHLFEKPKKSL